MKPMKRFLLSILLYALVASACKTAGTPVPARPATAPDWLHAYVDQLRLLRHDGAKSRIRLAAREPAVDGCAVAVRVRAAVLDKGSARFALETLGEPRLRDHRAQCRRLQPELEVVIAGFAATAGPDEMTARIDGVLQTAEAYLASKGIRFDLAPGDVPAEVACREVFATTAEGTLGRQVSAWPLPLLSIDPWYHDRSGRVRHEGEVAMDAIVGSDGRLHRPHLRTSLSDVHESAVLRALPLWRFTPARRADVSVPARIAVQPVLHIY